MHALIIEDEAIIATEIEELLRDCGFTSFDFAACEADAIEFARRSCPALIIADVRLQPGNGIDAVNEICSNGPIPVIFVTGSGREVEARMPGHTLVHKPFAGSELIVAVNHLMNGRHPQSPGAGSP